ncbi:MAG: EamA family transporter [Clostridia bacterium]|nr:EamA family transporter [Clostridia bacterium]
MKKIIKNPILLITLSMAVFGTIAPFVRKTGLASGEVALYRAILASILIAVFLLVTKQKIPFKDFKKATLPLLIFSGAAMAFNWIFLFEAYKYTTVSVATLSYYFAPVIVTVACPILFKEKIGLKGWICFLGSTLGIVLITGIGELSGAKSHLIGILFGLCAAALYATVVLLNKFIREVDGIHRTFLQFVSAIIVLIPYVVLTSGINVSGMNSKGMICLVTVGVVHTGITYCMYFTSLKNLPGQKAAILSYIDPLVAVIISITVLKESITPMQVLGGVLILGFTLWNEIKFVKK